jgi:hypothetical protein
MRIIVDRRCFLKHLQETTLKVVVLLSRVERDKSLGEIVNSQLFGRSCLLPLLAFLCSREE